MATSAPSPEILIIEKQQRADFVWDHKSIALAMRLKGWTKQQAAKELCVPYSTYCYSRRTGCSPKICDWVASIVMEPPHFLWPMRYPPKWRMGASPP